MTIRTVPLLAAAALVITGGATGADARTAAGVTTHRCGSTAAANGGKAMNIAARKVGCKTAKAVARRANGKPAFNASGFSCHMITGTYLCTKRGTKQTIGFNYRKSS
jgi:hypothetical protein